jgi:hypothetical protein
MFGAVVTAEGGAVPIGAHCVVMEHAVVRGTQETHGLARHREDRILDSLLLAAGSAVPPDAEKGPEWEAR